MATQQEPEYHVEIRTGISAETGNACLEFVVTTVREFTSFGYSINLGKPKAPSGHDYSIELGGISLPKVGRPQPGPARGIVQQPMPANGTYSIAVSRKAIVASCSFTVGNGAPGRLVEQEVGGLATFEVAGS